MCASSFQTPVVMKILLLSDIHHVRRWMSWVREQAEAYDLVCVAGDILDAYGQDYFLGQAEETLAWVGDFPKPLAICSGNHDANTPESIGEAAVSVPTGGVFAEVLEDGGRWMDCLSRAGVVTDNRTEVLSTPRGDVVVTTIPHDFTGAGMDAGLWESGAGLRAQTGAPWFVLHHDPPLLPGVGGTRGNRGLAEFVSEYQPDYVLSGHIHFQPYEGNFEEEADGTWCFNPGAPEAMRTEIRHAFPNHIILDTSSGEAEWRADGSGIVRRARRRGRARSKP